jgi:NAD(P)-dependent dehydrogenase (short-subunit alcohol dehydrogenase family)
MQTIFITGCSSGFGLAAARHFLDQGWHVIATMRHPDPALLPDSPRLRMLALDVTDEASIADAVAAAGPIDVLVNNAGIGLLSVVEGTSSALMHDVFATNTLGTMAVTRAVLPQMRERRAGVVINVSSATTLAPLPLLAVYTASKAAVNAFGASLALELAPFGVRVHTILPGRSPATSFGSNARPRMADTIPEAYAGFAQQVFAGMGAGGAVTQEQDVTTAIWRAATEPATPGVLPAGADALAIAAAASI